MKLKKIVVAKTTNIERNYLAKIESDSYGLISGLGLVEKAKQKIWEDLRKTYSLPRDKKLIFNKKTKEIYFEEWVKESK